ncbi:MAG: hypothetical protein QNK03_17465 [Myxococcota bacterium]|nr:hypothetical protein [Myxococcota bacterium]
MSALILYADVPGFYAEVERSADAALADRPVIVGGDPRKRGLVQSATADAIAAGVSEGMSVLEALERCPRARARRTQMPRYREAAKRLRVCLAGFSERLEPAGLGAAYLDVSAVPLEPDALAERVRERVRSELGLPLRVGAGPVKFVAFLAAEEAGPAGSCVVGIDEVAEFLAPLPASRLPGVGPNTAARLAELGAHRVGDIARLGRGPLEAALGNHGLTVLGMALGRGDDRIRAARHPQTLSQETTLPAPELDRGALSDQLRQLAERLERALVLEGLAARRLVLKVGWADGERTTRSRTVSRDLAEGTELLALAETLLGRTQAGSRPIRLLGLAATQLLRPARDDRQLALFPPER